MAETPSIVDTAPFYTAGPLDRRLAETEARLATLERAQQARASWQARVKRYVAYAALIWAAWTTARTATGAIGGFFAGLTYEAGRRAVY